MSNGAWQVLQIAPNDHPPFGDILSVYQSALGRLGVRVQTLVLSPATGKPVLGATYLDLDDLSNLRTGAAAIRAAVSGSPVLALCHRYRAYRLLRASRLRVPEVVTIAHEFGFFKRLQRRLEQRLFARDVRFAGVSPAVQAELAATVEAPLCLPNALDLDLMRAAGLPRADALAALGVAPSRSLTIGLVGRLVDKKSPGLAVSALRVLVDQGVDVRLLVIGDGPLAEALAHEARGLPVTFCGFVPDARRLLSALDVMLLTSKEVEAFGMVALEAMCTGIPVVAGPTPGPQFVLGGSGFYYTEREPRAIADAIMQVQVAADSGDLPDRLAHAEERAEREFSVQALARHLEELLPVDESGQG